MAEITQDVIQGSEFVTVTETVLGASDTLVYNNAQTQILTLRNGSGGPLTPLIVGAGATTIPVPKYGDLDVSPGKLLLSVPDTDVVAINLNGISAYLVGVVTITGADGMTATLTSIPK